MMECTIVSTCESKRNVYKHPKDYGDSAVRLAYSIHKNGGKCKDIPIHMWYGKGHRPSDDTMSKLLRLGCTVSEGICEYPEYPLFNKITAMQLKFPTKYTMWMDSDMYVLKDFSEMFNQKVDVSACDMAYINHKWVRKEDNHLWKKFYDMFGISTPVPRITTSMDNKEGNFYLCSGLVLFRGNSGFAELYQKTAHEVIASDVPDKTLNFTQTSLSLAILRGQYGYGIIPEKFQVFYSFYKHSLPEHAVIVHYQDRRVKEIKNADWNASELVIK